MGRRLHDSWPHSRQQGRWGVNWEIVTRLGEAELSADRDLCPPIVPQQTVPLGPESCTVRFGLGWRVSEVKIDEGFSEYLRRRRTSQC
jgi:hypothetical protein